MKGAGTITLAAGGLPVLVAWLVGLSGLPVAQRPITDVLAEVMAMLLLVLGWRFRRGRLVIAAAALALANFLVRELWPMPHRKPDSPRLPFCCRSLWPFSLCCPSARSIIQ